MAPRVVGSQCLGHSIVVALLNWRVGPRLCGVEVVEVRTRHDAERVTSEVYAVRPYAEL